MAGPFEALNAAGKAAYEYYQQVYCQGTAVFTIQPAFGADCKRDGYDLFENGEWANRFPTKWQAEEARAAAVNELQRSYEAALANPNAKVKAIEVELPE